LLRIEIPRQDYIELRHFVLDFNGIIATDGQPRLDP